MSLVIGVWRLGFGPCLCLRSLGVLLWGQREIGVHIPGGHLEGRASPRDSVGVHLLVDVIRNTIVRWAFLSSLLFLFAFPLPGPMFLIPFNGLTSRLFSAFPHLLSIRRLPLLISLVVIPFFAAKYCQEQGVDDDEEEGDNRRSNDDRWHDDVLDDGEILVPEGKRVQIWVFRPRSAGSLEPERRKLLMYTAASIMIARKEVDQSQVSGWSTGGGLLRFNFPGSKIWISGFGV
jgi:hypothetical protein